MNAVFSNWKQLATMAEAGDTLSIGSGLRKLLSVVSGNEAGMRLPVTAGSTSERIANEGLTTIGSTNGAKAFSMEGPQKGVHKILACTAGSTANLSQVTLAAGTFDGTNHIATFNANNDVLEVRGLSTARYAIISNVGSVALSTST